MPSKLVEHPRLGSFWIYDLPRHRPTDIGLPIFHTREVKTLKQGKAPLEAWADVITAKGVFPEAQVVSYFDPERQRQRTLKRGNRLGMGWSRPSYHAEEAEDNEST